LLIVVAEPLPDPTKFTKREGEADKHARRRKHADMEAEYNAVTCVAVYMLLMSFCQKGINKLRNHQEHMKMRHPDGDFVVSEGFDDGVLFCGPLFPSAHSGSQRCPGSRASSSSAMIARRS
jgi:serine/threonine-protein kinase ULK/ATG1